MWTAHRPHQAGRVCIPIAGPSGWPSFRQRLLCKGRLLAGGDHHTAYSRLTKGAHPACHPVQPALSASGSAAEQQPMAAAQLSPDAAEALGTAEPPAASAAAVAEPAAAGAAAVAAAAAAAEPQGSGASLAGEAQQEGGAPVPSCASCGKTSREVKLRRCAGCNAVRWVHSAVHEGWG